jgi:hypothetical protein
MLEMNELCWLAGLLEGEGCFHAQPQGRKRTPNLLIQVAMTDRDVVEHVAKLFGCNLRTPCKPRAHQHKTVYSVGVCGIKALGWMMTLYPLMGARRQAKIREIIGAARCPRTV